MLNRLMDRIDDGFCCLISPWKNDTMLHVVGNVSIPDTTSNSDKTICVDEWKKTKYDGVLAKMIVC